MPFRYKREVELTFDRLIDGGRCIGTDETGKKVMAYGILPGEIAKVGIIKSKRSFDEAELIELKNMSPWRVDPCDPGSYISTSPWQIMDINHEQDIKNQLILDAFGLHDIGLSNADAFYSGDAAYGYRNKVEFSWWWDNDDHRLDLSFFRRGTHGKIPVEGTSLAIPAINEAARRIRDVLRLRDIQARDLKSLIVRCSQACDVVAQLYVKEPGFEVFTQSEIDAIAVQGFELIYSEPKSPASRITEKLQSTGDVMLCDMVRGKRFAYPAESFFQVNLPAYEAALDDMSSYILAGTNVIDMYAGVGTIGLTIGGDSPTLVELDRSAATAAAHHAADQNSGATVIHAASEHSLDYIRSDATIILDPPRAGLHQSVVDTLLQKTPPRVVYLSCNPVTQARDIALLGPAYKDIYSRGYNFFPRTPHIEHLVVLERR